MCAVKDEMDIVTSYSQYVLLGQYALGHRMSMLRVCKVADAVKAIKHILSSTAPCLITSYRASQSSKLLTVLNQQGPVLHHGPRRVHLDRPVTSIEQLASSVVHLKVQCRK